MIQKSQQNHVQCQHKVHWHNIKYRVVRFKVDKVQLNCIFIASQENDKYEVMHYYHHKWTGMSFFPITVNFSRYHQQLCIVCL